MQSNKLLRVLVLCNSLFEYFVVKLPNLKKCDCLTEQQYNLLRLMEIVVSCLCKDKYILIQNICSSLCILKKQTGHFFRMFTTTFISLS